MQVRYSVYTYESARGNLQEIARNMTREQRRDMIVYTRNRLKSDKISASIVTYVNDKFHSSF